MNKRNITKKVARFIVGQSVGHTIATALARNASAENPIEKTEVFIGSMVTGYVVADVTKPWIDQKVDDLFDMFDEYKKN